MFRKRSSSPRSPGRGASAPRAVSMVVDFMKPPSVQKSRVANPRDRPRARPRPLQVHTNRRRSAPGDREDDRYLSGAAGQRQAGRGQVPVIGVVALTRPSSVDLGFVLTWTGQAQVERQITEPENTPFDVEE